MKTTVTSFRLSEETQQQLNALALTQRRSMTEVLRSLVADEAARSLNITTWPKPEDAEAVPVIEAKS